MTYSLSKAAWGVDVINMPDGRVNPEGTWQWMYDYAFPYSKIKTSVTVFPWFQIGGGVTKIYDVPGFSQGDTVYGSYGYYKDKTSELILGLVKEGDYWPSVALTTRDPIGTGLFKSTALAASKNIGPTDLTIGWGTGQVAGPFAAARYRLPIEANLTALVEYDANDYTKHYSATTTGIADSTQKVAYGLDYRWGWLGVTISRQHDQTGVKGYVNIPLQEKDFVPKIDEPRRYEEILSRPSADQWRTDPIHKARLVAALVKQDFRNVRVEYNDTGILTVHVSHGRISRMSRAVGRAAQAALLLSPLQTREIRVVYFTRDMPLATYTFVDATRLQRYFNGQITRRELANYVSISHAAPLLEAEKEADADQELYESLADEVGLRVAVAGDEPEMVSLKFDNAVSQRWKLNPRLRTYLNGPNAFQYSLDAYLSYNQRFAGNTELSLGFSYALAENISKYGTAPTDSKLPHVRSDFAEYMKDANVFIDRLVVNKFMHLSEGVYARASAGIYEQMFNGVGGQVLYLPRTAPWAVDLSLDAVQKRNTQGWFGVDDYKTITGIASLHYRLPQGVTATVRAGRFLARDSGVRMELKRRFESGFELGGWYTYTDANDFGMPAQNEGGGPYRDKGVFVSIPFNVGLTKDTQTRGFIGLAPWTRDVGQMVASPADLYSIFEAPLVNRQDRDGLRQLADIDDDYALPALGESLLDRNAWHLAADDMGNTGEMLSSGGTWLKMGMGVGLIGLSTVLDEPGERFAKNHGGKNWVKALARVGNLAPVAAVGIAGLTALDGSNARLSSTGMAALQASGVGVLSAMGTKYAVGRARPEAGLGPSHFTPGSGADRDASFFSGHTVAIWGAVTPFAKEYDMPWLYGIAGLTNFARVAKNKHWVSDTVAGTLIGYWLGSAFWEWRRSELLRRSEILVGPNSIGINVSLQ